MGFTSRRIPLDHISLYLDMSTEDSKQNNATQSPEVSEGKFLAETQTSEDVGNTQSQNNDAPIRQSDAVTPGASTDCLHRTNSAEFEHKFQ